MRRPIVRILLAAVLTLSSLTLPAFVGAVSPTPSAPMAMRLEAGRHTGYTFNSRGVITGSRAALVSSPATVQTTQRSSIGDRGVFLRMSTGPLAGYWIRESIMSHVVGSVGQRSFNPHRAIALPAGKVIGYKFDSGWSLVSAPVLTVPSAAQATASMSAVINGILYYRIVDGSLANTWVPSGGFHVARTLSCHTGPRATGGAAVWSRLTSAGPEVALTFDMGGRIDPAMAIAKRLLLNGVCATIFPTGDMAVTTAGHAVLDFMAHYPAVFEFANHTVDHCNLVSGGGGSGCPAGHASASFVQSQLANAESTIQSITGQNARPYWRPPYGAHDQAVRTAARDAGYPKTVMWHIDTIDWLHQNDGGPTTPQMITKVVGGAANGSIVLMHLGGWNTHAALPGMIHGLRGRGFVPSSISDLADGS